jgi:hypothetical protein
MQYTHAINSTGTPSISYPTTMSFVPLGTFEGGVHTCAGHTHLLTAVHPHPCLKKTNVSLVITKYIMVCCNSFLFTRCCPCMAHPHLFPIRYRVSNHLENQKNSARQQQTFIGMSSYQCLLIFQQTCQHLRPHHLEWSLFAFWIWICHWTTRTTTTTTTTTRMKRHHDD